MNKVAYTIILNDYDELKEPLVITPGWRYICFSNKYIKSKTWEVRKIKINKSAHLTTREYFICPYRFFAYDVAIMFGGQMQINCNLDDYIHDEKKYDIGIVKHKWNTDPFMEMRACKHLNKITTRQFNKINNRYKTIIGEKKLTGVATGGTIYFNTIRARKLQEYWWLETLHYCKRDQVSFPLARYLNKDVKVKYLPYKRYFGNILYYKHNGELITQ